jgi:Cdc6-like AAA superfamily ATPase
VLFIDEAYSLVDDCDSYGDEAINTIVQEMENMREDVVVIFAGYTDEMERFLQKNPGLRSRISFHVPFADYDSQELLQILDLMAADNSFSVDISAKAKLLSIIDKARKIPDFGNGRYMRNLFETARMNQASRLLAGDVGKIPSVELTRLVADDFEELPTLSKGTASIGFLG